MPFTATNPVTGQHLRDVPSLDNAALLHALSATYNAHREWRSASLASRSSYITRVGALLRERRDALANVCTEEMGKPLAGARAEIEKCALLCDVAADMAERALAPEHIASDARGAWRVEYQAMGVVLTIMPWNFPYWQAMRVIVPNVLLGNGVLHKPAGSVPGCGEALHALLADAARDTDAPPAIASLILANSGDLEPVIADPRVCGVTLTGSEGAGQSVAALAGKHLKKVVLELGGSDPFLVLADADVQRAADAAVKARTVNSGQSCIAAKRFIVHTDIYDDFLTHFVKGMGALVVGDPREQTTEIGPLATESIRDEIAQQVQESVAAGARIAVGGSQPERDGFFYQPTVLTDIPDDAPAAREEIFGPVAAVFRVSSLDEAITRANDTPFGLGASVWTRDPAHAARCVAELEAGMVFVNEPVVSDPRVPFGGIKTSGIGRELGYPGFREFANIKTIRVAE